MQNAGPQAKAARQTVEEEQTAGEGTVGTRTWSLASILVGAFSLFVYKK
jgi:hypothetical protein